MNTRFFTALSLCFLMTWQNSVAFGDCIVEYNSKIDEYRAKKKTAEISSFVVWPLSPVMGCIYFYLRKQELDLQKARDLITEAQQGHGKTLDKFKGSIFKKIGEFPSSIEETIVYYNNINMFCTLNLLNYEDILAFFTDKKRKVINNFKEFANPPSYNLYEYN